MIVDMDESGATAHVVLHLPSALRMHSQGRARLNLRAATVREALHAAGREHDTLLQHIMTRDHQHLRPFVNVFVRQDDIRNLQGLDTRLRQGDTVMVVPSVAGG